VQAALQRAQEAMGQQAPQRVLLGTGAGFEAGAASTGVGSVASGKL